MRTIRFGIIGCGLMGREFADAAARWCHLAGGESSRPEPVAVCDTDAKLLQWYRSHFASVRQATTDYRELLANPEVQAVYFAVPHKLHRQIYCDAVEAGKHLMGEKPFGVDREAHRAILACAARHPDLLVRCSSEFPFYPGVQRIAQLIESRAFGRILEVNAGFLHSSDLDSKKPLNWKRIVEINGEYGCMGDLGMHVCHVPFRAGWRPQNVRAILSKIVAERPDGRGGVAPCETWDNATLLCETFDPVDGCQFPMTLKTQRIAPGETNTWFLEVLATRVSARFSTRNPRQLEILDYRGGEQAWQEIQLGYQAAFPTITGGIFEFGFPDAILQMWAAFAHELQDETPPPRFARCVTPDETARSHDLFTAALQSHRERSVVMLAHGDIRKAE